MGRSWALLQVQAAHQHILDSSGLVDGERRAVDFKPTPRPTDGALYSLYVDNVIVAGHDAEEVTKVRRAASQALVNTGLPVHEETDTQDDMECLSVRQRGDPPEVCLSKKRYWRIFVALEWLVERRRAATSKEMEVLVGHLTFGCLVRRESLCILRSCYDFRRAGHQRRVPIWPSAMRELQIMQGMLVLLRQHMGASFCCTVSALDACTSGHASDDTGWKQTDVEKTAERLERWRYNDDSHRMEHTTLESEH